jgi:hypothetical protein
LIGTLGAGAPKEIGFDWFIPLFGFSQYVLFFLNLRPINLCDNTHTGKQAFKPMIQFGLSFRTIKNKLQTQHPKTQGSP